MNLAYLLSFEILVPAFSSAQLALTAASVAPLKSRQNRGRWRRRRGTAGFLGTVFPILNDTDGEIIYIEYFEQVFLGLYIKKKAL